MKDQEIIKLKDDLNKLDFQLKGKILEVKTHIDESVKYQNLYTESNKYNQKLKNTIQDVSK